MNRPSVTAFLATAVLSTTMTVTPLTIVHADDTPTASPTAQTEPSVDSWMPDKNLQTSVQTLLGADVPLTQANLAKLTVIDLTYSDVTNLKGLEFAKNLQQLDLTGNAISDISPLSQLTQLTNLSLRLNKATQLPDLQQLQNVPIQQLNLVGDAYGSAPAQLAGLANLTQLQSLKLVNSKLTTFPPIAPTAPLTALDLSGNKLTDMTGLANFKGLTTLSLGSNLIADWRPVAGLTQLTNLTAGNNPQTNIGVLKTLTQLQKLNLSQLGMTNQDLKLISGMGHLQNLAIDFNGNISDLTPISQLTQLTNLDFSKDAVSDLTPLQPLSQLANLTLSNNLVTDLTPLRHLSQLASLTILRNQVRDLSPLKDLRQLTALNAKYQFITLPSLALPLNQPYHVALNATDIDGSTIPLTYQNGINATVSGNQVTYPGISAAGQTNFAWDNATSTHKLSTRFSGSLVQPVTVMQNVPQPAPTQTNTADETVKLSVMKGDNPNLTSVASNYILQKATLTKHADDSGMLTFTANVPKAYGKDSILFKDATRVSADEVGDAVILTYQLPLSATQLAQDAILEDMQVAINLPGFDYNHAYQVYFKITHTTDFVANQPTPPLTIPTAPTILSHTTATPAPIAAVVASTGTPLVTPAASTATALSTTSESGQQAAPNRPTATTVPATLAPPVNNTKIPAQPHQAASKPTQEPASSKSQKLPNTPHAATRQTTKIAVFATSLLGILGLYALRFLKK
ncbi:hypothetical protein [Leuconostoc holzapfelii]|uniref:Uncharacterized protein n=1 Tax=Leuconostoc holzapfelii TaxID=434464 RepID=A0A846ZAM6_9LACO|nr:hypothetical protein [Leuconostoc holzapfelii]NKZ18817.1 hypothetical protein [Leuconostoc holzapfelii]